MDVEVRGKVRKWGNSYALRLRKQDVDRLGLKEGQEIRALLAGLPEKIDLSGLPTFTGGKPFAWKDRDIVAGEGYWKMRADRE